MGLFVLARVLVRHAPALPTPALVLALFDVVAEVLAGDLRGATSGTRWLERRTMGRLARTRRQNNTTLLQEVEIALLKLFENITKRGTAIDCYIGARCRSVIRSGISRVK